MKNVTDAIFSAIQGGALAALNGQLDTTSAQLKREIESLNEQDVEALQASKIGPQQWADIILSGISLGKKIRDIVRSNRGLP